MPISHTSTSTGTKSSSAQCGLKGNGRDVSSSTSSPAEGGIDKEETSEEPLKDTDPNEPADVKNDAASEEAEAADDVGTSSKDKATNCPSEHEPLAVTSRKDDIEHPADGGTEAVDVEPQKLSAEDDDDPPKQEAKAASEDGKEADATPEEGADEGSPGANVEDIVQEGGSSLTSDETESDLGAVDKLKGVKKEEKTEADAQKDGTENDKDQNLPQIKKESISAETEETSEAKESSDDTSLFDVAAIRAASETSAASGTAAGRSYKEYTAVIPRNESQWFGVLLEEKDGTCFVKKLKPGSASAASGQVQPGDKVLKVNGTSVVDMTLVQIANAIRQTKETESLILHISRCEKKTTPLHWESGSSTNWKSSGNVYTTRSARGRKRSSAGAFMTPSNSASDSHTTESTGGGRPGTVGAEAAASPAGGLVANPAFPFYSFPLVSPPAVAAAAAPTQTRPAEPGSKTMIHSAEEDWLESSPTGAAPPKQHDEQFGRRKRGRPRKNKGVAPPKLQHDEQSGRRKRGRPRKKKTMEPHGDPKVTTDSAAEDERSDSSLTGAADEKQSGRRKRGRPRKKKTLEAQGNPKKVATDSDVEEERPDLSLAQKEEHDEQTSRRKRGRPRKKKPMEAQGNPKKVKKGNKRRKKEESELEDDMTQELELKEFIPLGVCSYLKSIGIETCKDFALAKQTRLAGKLDKWAKSKRNSHQKTKKRWERDITSWLAEMTRRRYLTEAQKKKRRRTRGNKAERKVQLSSTNNKDRNDEQQEEDPLQSDLSTSELENDWEGCKELPTLDETFDLEKADPEWMATFRSYAKYKRTATVIRGNQKRDDALTEWANDQRKLRFQVFLSQDDTTTPESVQLYLHKRHKLDSIQFVWNPDQKPPSSASEEWKNYFLELKRYLKQRGDTSVSDTVELGTWTAMQRMKHQSNTLEPKLVKALTNIGFQWTDPQADWWSMFRKLTKHKEDTGDCYLPRLERDPEKEEDEDEEYAQLLLWSHRQRREYDIYLERQSKPFHKSKVKPRSTLTSDQIAQLENLGFVWSTGIQPRWYKKYRELKAHKEAHGNFDAINWSEPLGVFAYELRHQRRMELKGRKNASRISHLTPEKVALLDKIEFNWHTGEYSSWEERFELLREFKEEHGHCLVPNRVPKHDRFHKLGEWVKNQRKAYELIRNGGDPKNYGSWLTEDKIAYLNELGFVWRVRGKGKSAGLGSEKDVKNMEMEGKIESSSLLVATGEEEGKVENDDLEQDNNNGEVAEEGSMQDQFVEEDEQEEQFIEEEDDQEQQVDEDEQEEQFVEEEDYQE